jgi:hypothetical protein
VVGHTGKHQEAPIPKLGLCDHQPATEMVMRGKRARTLSDRTDRPLKPKIWSRARSAAVGATALLAGSG